jgi:hypothetical protein
VAVNPAGVLSTRVAGVAEVHDAELGDVVVSTRAPRKGW